MSVRADFYDFAFDKAVRRIVLDMDCNLRTLGWGLTRASFPTAARYMIAELLAVGWKFKVHLYTFRSTVTE